MKRLEPEIIDYYNTEVLKMISVWDDTDGGTQGICMF